MIAISFLGLGKKNKDTGVYEYEKTKYEYAGRVVETCYFPYAVKEFTEPEKLAVIMTEKASGAHSEGLREKCEYETIIIPEGKTEKEIWEIFGKIADYVPENAEIILDITHGLRSQPVILLACLIYLKALKNVKLLKILYAAFEARAENNVTPVFDLKPFLDLMDWSYGVYEFVHNGNSKEFRKLLEEAQRNTHLSTNPDKAKRLAFAGKYLEGFTNALSVVNVNDILESAKRFMNELPVIINDAERIAEAKPFELLLDKVTHRINKLGKPYDKNERQRFIEANLEIIKWYLETEQYQQAITLMTELFITVECVTKGINPYNDKDRINESSIIGDEIQNTRINKSLNREESGKTELYRKLGESRNEINHAGMKEKVLKINGTNQIKRIKKYFAELEEYIKKLKIDADKPDEPSV